MFVLEWLFIDIIVILVVVILMVLGLVIFMEGIVGFSNFVIVIIMVMFILSYGIICIGII